MTGDPQFGREADLCQAFIEFAGRHGWTAYPEQGGWDILLVRADVQVGVQAKLVADLHVLEQVLPEQANYRVTEVGPTYRAILVGRFAGRTLKAVNRTTNAFYKVCEHLGVIVLQPPVVTSGTWLRAGYHSNRCVVRKGKRRVHTSIYRWKPGESVWVPPFVPDLPAGVPCPQTVSAWNVAAVRLEMMVSEQGAVYLDDARAVTAEVSGRWNPATLLNRFFKCDRRGRRRGRQLPWVVRVSPSKAYPKVADGLKPQ